MMRIQSSALILPLALGLGVCALFCSASFAQAQLVKGKTYSLFNGKNLKGWKVTDFGGQGEVTVEKKRILLPLGQDMSGITWDQKTSPLKFKLPKENYEINLEAMRVDGSDFFCGMTFPVGDAFCSLILGGWGGGVVGLSSIHGFDASENETTQYAEFENKRWYKVRLRVTKQNVAVWLDGKEVIDVARKDNEFSVRFEMELSKPLGFATWQTIAALRNISLTLLEAPAADEGDNEPSPSDRPIEKPQPKKKPAEAPVAQPPLPETAAATDTPCAAATAPCAEAGCVQNACRRSRCRAGRCRRSGRSCWSRGCRGFRRCR